MSSRPAHRRVRDAQTRYAVERHLKLSLGNDSEASPSRALFRRAITSGRTKESTIRKREENKEMLFLMN